jgi:hypothetical protein
VVAEVMERLPVLNARRKNVLCNHAMSDLKGIKLKQLYQLHFLNKWY